MKNGKHNLALTKNERDAIEAQKLRDQGMFIHQIALSIHRGETFVKENTVPAKGARIGGYGKKFIDTAVDLYIKEGWPAVQRRHPKLLRRTVQQWIKNKKDANTPPKPKVVYFMPPALAFLHEINATMERLNVP